MIAMFSHFLSSFWDHDWLASGLFVFCIWRNILHAWSGKRTGEYGKNFLLFKNYGIQICPFQRV